MGGGLGLGVSGNMMSIKKKGQQYEKPTRYLPPLGAGGNQNDFMSNYNNQPIQNNRNTKIQQ